MLRYENQTSTTLQLVEGDVRNAQESFVVIGRCPALKNHYETLMGELFSPVEDPGWDHSIQVCQNENLSVLRTTYRPRSSSCQRQTQAMHLQCAVELPMAMTFASAKQVAMIPLSFRQPQIVAKAMIRMIWDISVAAFLGASQTIRLMKPEQFTIYCDGPLDPFIHELESGHYASLRHGWLFNFDVKCNAGKRTRYLRRSRFKFKRVSASG